MITAQRQRNAPKQRTRDFTLIGALPGAIAYTRTAGEHETSPTLELKMPAEPEQRRELQIAGAKRSKRQNIEFKLENRTFQR
jgi:hypothetical protein